MLKGAYLFNDLYELWTRFDVLKVWLMLPTHSAAVGSGQVILNIHYAAEEVREWEVN